MPITKSLTANLPQAGSWPLLGALPALMIRPFEFFEEARRRHGDIYSLRVGRLRPVVLNHPRHIQHVLRDHAANYRKGGAIYDSMRQLFGNGLVVSEGEFWLRQRRMMQPQFHRERLAGLSGLMVNAVAESLASWAPYAGDGRPVNLLPALARMTMRVTTDALFGMALPRETRDEVGDALCYVLDYLMFGMAAHGLPSWLPIPGKRRNLRELARIERIVEDTIAATRRSRGEHHLLAMLLDGVGDQMGEGMSGRERHDEVTALFIAGYETTSTALGWAVHYLMGHPEVMQKLQDEVDGVLGGRTPAFADLPQLGYTRMVLQEVLRLRPPSYWLPRVGRRGRRDRGLPDRGRHRRHLDDVHDPSPPFAWVPFGAGQHLCIGRDFAMMEGTLILAMIVQRYRFAAVKGRVAEAGLSATLRPKGGVWAHLAARDRG